MFPKRLWKNANDHRNYYTLQNAFTLGRNFIALYYSSSPPSGVERSFHLYEAVEKTEHDGIHSCDQGTVRESPNPGLGSVVPAETGSDFRVEVHTDQHLAGLEDAIQLSRKYLPSAAGHRFLSLPQTLLPHSGVQISLPGLTAVRRLRPPDRGLVMEGWQNGHREDLRTRQKTGRGACMPLLGFTSDFRQEPSCSFQLLCWLSSKIIILNSLSISHTNI